MSRSIEIKNSAKKRKTISKIVIHAVLIFISALMILPIIYMINRSFMEMEDLDSLYAKFIPSKWSVSAYVKAFDPDLVQSLLVTVLVVLFNVIAVPLSASFVAFGFSRCEFVGRDVWFAILLSTMMLPGIVLQIPIYIIYNNIGWIPLL